ARQPRTRRRDRVRHLIGLSDCADRLSGGGGERRQMTHQNFGGKNVLLQMKQVNFGGAWAAFQAVCSKRCGREKVERSMLDFACWRPHPCSERDVEEICRLRLLPSRSDDVCREKE